MDIEKVKEKGQSLQTTLHVGKNGVTDSLIEELDNQLDNNEIVKIKILRNNPVQDVEEIAKEIKEKSIGELAETRGKTVLMFYED